MDQAPSCIQSARILDELRVQEKGEILEEIISKIPDGVETLTDPATQAAVQCYFKGERPLAAKEGDACAATGFGITAIGAHSPLCDPGASALELRRADRSILSYIATYLIAKHEGGNRVVCVK